MHFIHLLLIFCEDEIICGVKNLHLYNQTCFARRNLSPQKRHLQARPKFVVDHTDKERRWKKVSVVRWHKIELFGFIDDKYVSIMSGIVFIFINKACESVQTSKRFSFIKWNLLIFWLKNSCVSCLCPFDEFKSSFSLLGSPPTLC